MIQYKLPLKYLKTIQVSGVRNYKQFVKNLIFRMKKGKLCWKKYRFETVIKMELFKNILS